MGIPTSPAPVVLFCGLLSRTESRLETVEEKLQQTYGPIREKSPVLSWDYSDYYAAEMGKPLLRQFLFFEKKIFPERLSDIKQESNALETALAEYRNGRLCRTVNIDPGYITSAKVVLATTKDFAHRIYLRNGIYAEVTLMFQGKSFTPLAYTYPDFRSEKYISLFNAVRQRVFF